MSSRKAAVVVLFVMVVACACLSQTRTASRANATALSVQEMAGGTVVTEAPGRSVNQGSTLQRQWFIINDPNCPVQLSETGVTTVFETRQGHGEFTYHPTGRVAASAAISAYEVRFVLFDVWGNHLQTLSATRLADMQGSLPLHYPTWYAWESDVRSLFTVVSFVANVRTLDGHMWKQDPGTMVRTINGIQMKIAETDLVPEREMPPVGAAAVLPQ